MTITCVHFVVIDANEILVLKLRVLNLRVVVKD